MQRGGILRNLPCSANRLIGVRQMSVTILLRTLKVVKQYGLQRISAVDSFSFFTGLCEKGRWYAAFPHALSAQSQTIAAQKDWNDCACAL